MGPLLKVSQPRHGRRNGLRPSTRPGRQECVPRGSATVVSSNSNLTVADGGEPSSCPNPNPSPIPNPNPNPDPVSSYGGLRPKGQYVVRKRETEVPESAAAPQLVQEIQDKLVKGAVECMICYDVVKRSAPTWSCSSCYSIFHLNCIKKWAHTEKIQGLNWRCPGCRSVQLVSGKEIRYACFCGRRTDPPSDSNLMPHSCGEPCWKPLDR